MEIGTLCVGVLKATASSEVREVTVFAVVDAQLVLLVRRVASLSSVGCLCGTPCCLVETSECGRFSKIGAWIGDFYGGAPWLLYQRNPDLLEN